MLRTVKQYLQHRRGVKDLSKIQDLMDTFVSDVRDVAIKQGSENDLDTIELNVLGTFVVSEIYLGISPDKQFASAVLDDCHEIAAEKIFDARLESLEESLSAGSEGELYDRFMESFYKLTKERYLEYRNILFDGNGHFHFSEQHFPELGGHLLQTTSKLAASEQVANPSFERAVLDHMVRCGETFHILR